MDWIFTCKPSVLQGEFSVFLIFRHFNYSKCFDIFSNISFEVIRLDQRLLKFDLLETLVEHA